MTVGARSKKFGPMPLLRAALSAVAVALPLLVTACDGPSAASVVQGEPVCPDFEIGAAKTKMHGGLKQPLQFKIMDGSTVVAQMILVGLPAEGEPTRFLLPDGNNEYSVEWRQCPNERAPDPVGPGSKPGKKGRDATSYTCGKVDPYKTDKLITKKGQPSTRTVVLPPPPNGACWTGTDAEGPGDAPEPSVTASASAAPTEAPPPSATAEATASATAAPSASSPPASTAKAASSAKP